MNSVYEVEEGHKRRVGHKCSKELESWNQIAKQEWASWGVNEFSIVLVLWCIVWVFSTG